MKNKEIAKDTLEILDKKLYENNKGKIINLEKELEVCLSSTKFYSSENLEKLLDNQTLERIFETKYEILRIPTVDAILKIAQEENHEKIMCLNFASAKNPGGGFINGAQAQEESIARVSALYSSQLKAPEFYEKHKDMKSCIYTDSMIYSPLTPIFKNNNGEVLNNLVFCNFITSAAVNTGVVKRVEQDLINKIEKLMFNRIDKMLALSYENENETLILGAWGCGVFQNDPILISNLFKKHFDAKYKNVFKRVIFAVFTKNDDLFNNFKFI
jgi:uncharacterized protein (TIGR02452 family)